MARAARALAAAAMVAVGCSQPAEPLQWEDLANATYQSRYTDGGTVTLSGGEFVDEPNRIRIVIPRRLVARGDLNGDGVLDAAVIVVSATGGSGTFEDVAAVLNRNGVPDHVASQFLGDRVKINALSIESGEIVIDMVAHGPDDPMCCPTEQKVVRLRLEDGALEESSAGK